MHRSIAARVCALVLVLPVLGCSGRGADDAAAVLHLADLYAPPKALLELAEGGRAYAERFEIAADAWKPEQPAGLWSVRAPWYGGPLPVLVHERAGLVLDGDMALRPSGAELPTDLTEAGTFAVLTLPDGDYVFARLSADARPGPGRLDILVSAGAPGRERSSPDAPGGRVRPWHVAGGAHGGDGFVVRADAPAALVVDVPPSSRLLFDVACVGEVEGRSVVLRVRCNGEVLAEQEIAGSQGDTLRAQEIVLPADGARAARLELELDGQAWCAIFGPRIAPAEPGRHAPDIVLFLADTFRADNLAFYGGEAGVTPELDAFAATGLRAEKAWAPACWTLPSHASMFLGVDPMQHGAVDPRFMPAEGLVSIAEKLRAAGYRTAAVTDSLFVSRRYSLDRGFEHFEEHNERDIEHTIRRAREIAARDDGRPLFLFVHTYRAHEPYEVTAETRAELGEQLGLGPTWDDLVQVIEAEVIARTKAGDPNMARLLSGGNLHEILIELGLLDPASPRSGSFLAAIRALYRGGARDLDRAFGAFLDDVDAGQRDTWILFTSDHGEAFGEHASIFHGYGVWEENLRIPLLIRGPGLAPRTLTHPTSLVDLPHTLAEIAGIAPDPSWSGRSLLSLDEDRAIFSFDCAQRGDPHGAVIDRGLKVVFEPSAESVRAGRVTSAFDLVTDPAELDDLGAAPRATSVLERLAEDALERMRPIAAPGRANVDAAQLRNMQQLGYAGFDDK